MEHGMHGKMSELDNALMSKMKRKKMRGKGKMEKPSSGGTTCLKNSNKH